MNDHETRIFCKTVIKTFFHNILEKLKIEVKQNANKKSCNDTKYLKGYYNRA